MEVVYLVPMEVVDLVQEVLLHSKHLFNECSFKVLSECTDKLFKTFYKKTHKMLTVQPKLISL